MLSDKSLPSGAEVGPEAERDKDTTPAEAVYQRNRRLGNRNSLQKFYTSPSNLKTISKIEIEKQKLTVASKSILLCVCVHVYVLIDPLYHVC